MYIDVWRWLTISFQVQQVKQQSIRTVVSPFLNWMWYIGRMFFYVCAWICFFKYSLATPVPSLGGSSFLAHYTHYGTYCSGLLLSRFTTQKPCCWIIHRPVCWEGTVVLPAPGNASNVSIICNVSFQGTPFTTYWFLTLNGGIRLEMTPTFDYLVVIGAYPDNCAISVQDVELVVWSVTIIVQITMRLHPSNLDKNISKCTLQKQQWLFSTTLV